jgi:hypothetical protein
MPKQPRLAHPSTDRRRELLQGIALLAVLALLAFFAAASTAMR